MPDRPFVLDRREPPSEQADDDHGDDSSEDGGFLLDCHRCLVTGRSGANAGWHGCAVHELSLRLWIASHQCSASRLHPSPIGFGTGNVCLLELEPAVEELVLRHGTHSSASVMVGLRGALFFRCLLFRRGRTSSSQYQQPNSPASHLKRLPHPHLPQEHGNVIVIELGSRVQSPPRSSA